MLRYNKKYFYLIVAILVFMLFGYMSVLTPLAGDDWGYAINGLKENPFIAAYNFYFSWSGRYFSELWGFIVAPRKWLWNILNPTFFTAIYILMYKIINPKRNQVSIAILIFALMITVNNYLRMETYTWIMGTTYVIPLLLILLYIFFSKALIDRKSQLEWYKWLLFVFINIYTGLAMENAIASLIMINVVLIIYTWNNNRELFKFFLIMFFVSCLSFCVLRMSPGSTYRTLRDFSYWLEMPIFQQINTNWTSFISYTIIENKYLILMLSLFSIILIINNLRKKTKFKFVSVLLLFVFIVGLIPPVSLQLYSRTNLTFFRLFYDITSLESALYFCTIFIFIYIIAIFVLIYTQLPLEKRPLATLLLIAAGTSNLVMLFSPIFGARSSIYLVYLITVFIGLIVSEIKLNFPVKIVITSIIVLICGLKIHEYIGKYQLVNEIQKERLEIIQYYVDHPKEKEAWIPRMPIYSIHAADIEPSDEYHLETFKEYYGLPDDMNVIFYFKQTY